MTGGVSEAVCPVVTLDPNSQTVCTGDSVTFNVAASGTPAPAFQWRFNGGNIDGATGDSYTINPADPNAAGNYDCVATNSCGSDTSDPASLTVNVSPTFSTQPDAQAACAGGSVTFTTVADGTPAPTYQWRHDGEDIGGATGSSYTIDPVDPNDAGSYDCVAANSCGTLASDAVALTINTAPGIILSPLVHTAIVGQATTFTASADGVPAPTYQWRKNGGSLFDGGSISGATTDTLIINAVAKTDSGSYDVVVTNACNAATSTAATLWLAGDLNCDGLIDYADINPFVIALTGQAAYEAQRPNCFWMNADLNGDNVVNYADINPFVALLSAP